DHRVVAERDLFFEHQRADLVRDVQRAVVLDVRPRADPDVAAVPADDGGVPDGDVVAEDHVSDDRRGLGDENPGADARRHALVAPEDHLSAPSRRYQSAREVPSDRDAPRIVRTGKTRVKTMRSGHFSSETHRLFHRCDEYPEVLAEERV